MSKLYVVWNGSIQRPHVAADLNFAIVTDDLKTVSIRELLSWSARPGDEAIIIFGCAPGGTTLSTGHGGVFSLALCERFALWKTLRNLISEINEDIERQGYEQRAEVICRLDLLNVPIEELAKHSDGVTLMMQFDMCRPLPDEERGE